MSLQVEKLEKNMAKLTIEVSAEDLDKAMEKAYQKQKSRISLPGFRKGKAPRKMIESVGALRLMYLCLLKQWQMPLWHRECQENRPISLLPRLYLEVRSCFWRQACIREN